jgi:hypothetical protein
MQHQSSHMMLKSKKVHHSRISGIISRMRTTINLDDEPAEIAAQYAKSRQLTLGKAIGELILRSTRTTPRIKYVDGLPVFDMPREPQAITTARIKAFEADER